MLGMPNHDVRHAMVSGPGEAGTTLPRWTTQPCTAVPESCTPNSIMFGASLVYTLQST